MWKVWKIEDVQFSQILHVADEQTHSRFEDGLDYHVALAPVVMTFTVTISTMWGQLMLADGSIHQKCTTKHQDTLDVISENVGVGAQHLPSLNNTNSSRQPAQSKSKWKPN